MIRHINFWVKNFIKLNKWHPFDGRFKYNQIKQEACGPLLAYLSEIATVDTCMQMLCNFFFPILLLQQMKKSSFEQFLALNKYVFLCPCHFQWWWWWCVCVCVCVGGGGGGRGAYSISPLSILMSCPYLWKKVSIQ